MYVAMQAYAAYCMCTVSVPYSGKFSRGPIFAEWQSSKISQSNFRGWLFQNCSTQLRKLGSTARPLDALKYR